MIERTNSFKVGEKSFLTLLEAQKYEIQQLLDKQQLVAPGLTPVKAIDIAEWILNNKVAILDILTMTPNSKPKARRINGGTKRRTVITDAAVNVTSISNVPSPVSVTNPYVAQSK
jgi:hypothetical protein